MSYADIVAAVDRLNKKHGVSDPFELCSLLGIKILLRSMGTEKDAVKLNQENLPQVYVLPIETEINPELIDKVMRKCRLK